MREPIEYAVERYRMFLRDVIEPLRRVTAVLPDDDVRATAKQGVDLLELALGRRTAGSWIKRANRRGEDRLKLAEMLTAMSPVPIERAACDVVADGAFEIVSLLVEFDRGGIRPLGSSVVEMNA